MVLRLKYMIPAVRDRWKNGDFVALLALGEGRDDFRKVSEKYMSQLDCNL